MVEGSWTFARLRGDLGSSQMPSSVAGTLEPKTPHPALLSLSEEDRPTHTSLWQQAGTRGSKRLHAGEDLCAIFKIF